MPLASLELVIKFVVHVRHELHVLLQKNVLEMNAILVRHLGCL